MNHDLGICTCDAITIAAWAKKNKKRGRNLPMVRVNQTQVRCGRCGRFKHRIDDAYVKVVGRCA